jgi:hypothetical protein
MSVIPGVFSETRLLQQRHLADQLSLDGRIKLQFMPEKKVYDYIKGLQTAKLNTAFNSRAKKDFTVEVMWMNTCADLTIADESCVRGGLEASTNAETYELTKRIVKGFTINDADFRDNEFEADEAVAKLMLQADKQITEEFTQYLVACLNLYSGVNQVATGKGTIDPVDDTITNIVPANWTADLMAYFSRVMILNRFPNAALISGNNLYETLFIAMANAANAEGKGDFILWGKNPIWFDLFNIDTVNDPDFFTYMVNEGSLAMVNKAFNPAMAKYMDHYAYTMPSRFLNGFTYDVYYDNKCNDDARFNDTVQHNYKVVLTADCFKNPFGCDAVEGEGGVVTGENTGILRFRNQA